MDVSVLALRCCDKGNELVHYLIKLRVFGDSIDSCHGFAPFVHVAVMESRAMMLTLHLS